MLSGESREKIEILIRRLMGVGKELDHEELTTLAWGLIIETQDDPQSLSSGGRRRQREALRAKEELGFELTPEEKRMSAERSEAHAGIR
jgi:hypothetical protein